MRKQWLKEAEEQSIYHSSAISLSTRAQCLCYVSQSPRLTFIVIPHHEKRPSNKENIIVRHYEDEERGRNKELRFLVCSKCGN